MPSTNNSDFKLTNNIDNQVWFILIGSARLPYLGIGDWGLGIGDWGLGIGKDKVADVEKLMTNDQFI
jgi:hypothetical protein